MPSPMPSPMHFFLASSERPDTALPPERWMVAFPEGQWGFWPALSRQVRPADVVWVSVRTSDWSSKVSELRRAHPACHVVVMSPVLQDEEGLTALNLGARGYCHLLASPDLLREVAQLVSHGGLWIGPELVQRLVAATRNLLDRSPNAPLPQTDLSVLSERELQVARAVADGKSNREVAEQLFISERTVKAHLGAAFEKLGVRDRVQLVLHLQRSANAGLAAPRPTR